MKRLASQTKVHDGGENYVAQPVSVLEGFF